MKSVSEEIEFFIAPDKIKQLFPGDEIIEGKLIRNKVNQINTFDKLLKNLEDTTNEYINKKIKTKFKLFFKDENRFDKNRVLPSAKSNEIYFITDISTWLQIITGKLNLETILIGGNGVVIKIHEENMRDVAMCISEFAYIYQNRNTKNLFN